MKKCGYIFVCLFALLSMACERDIDLDIPGGEQKIVVEGWIEPGAPPIVILTRSQPYFGNSTFSSLEGLFVHNAAVTVSQGTYSSPLFEICSASVPDSLLPFISGFLGIDSATLASVNYCVYTTFDPQIFGQVGESYRLHITTSGQELYAQTHIPQPVSLDSLWFKLAGSDSLGFVWARLTDPDTTGNAYRWFAMRKGKDLGYIAPTGSAFDDNFFNGTSFDFGFARGRNSFSTTSEPPEERGYFKKGDTILVKFCSIDEAHYQFWRTFEIQVISNGNPFASPAPVNSNIHGGLGVWGGYSPAYDTLIAQ